MKKKDKENKEEKKKKRVILPLLLLILVILGGFYGYKFYHKYTENGGGIKGAVAATFDLQKDPNLPPINCLVLGTNEDNTDTIMVGSYNPKTNEASLLSIPRDTFIGYNVNYGGANDKINSVYRNHGVEAIKERVEKMLDMKIPYYVIIDTKGVNQLVDAIGGVTFDVPIDMQYHDDTIAIELQHGVQKLNGKQAEGLLRFRHNDDGTTYPFEYGIQDRGRNKTQQNFIKETLKQTLVIQNVPKISEFIKIVQDNVKTNMPFDLMKKYIAYALDFNPENMQTGIVPGKDVNTTAWFFLPDKEKLKKEVFRLFVFSDDPRKVTFEGEEDQTKPKTTTSTPQTANTYATTR